MTGQRRNYQINTLGDLASTLEGQHWQVRNGYIMSNTSSLSQMNSEIEIAELCGQGQALRGKVRVGIHQDVQVTSSDWGRHPIRNERHVITQVWRGSSCSLALMNE